ncbi:phosphoadenosine phosphosulfate reductase family protein [Faecalibaculum rodentium]|uniref:phosphoadenosine phosphosulfate reductase family protein n=1 Tax=Faecalibaculum rodentium TaxID=1702221 RepID=UPI0025B742CF|nr:phosphoadenosine phosphosulfate reductase family protein [Faecalibaculum rodentium]
MIEDFELTLWDRLEMIRAVLQTVPYENIYLSFSGGKDSTVLHHMLDEALPGNTIERVFSNTGIEFNDVVDFVKGMAAEDSRIKIITPNRNIKQMLEEVGYPFKSKFHSEMVERFQKSGVFGKSLERYLSNPGSPGRYNVPKKLVYQFDPEFKLKISQKCCNELKKKPFKQYEKESGKTLCITGVRANEGGIRQYQADKHGCIFRNSDGEIYKFNPLSPVSDEFMDWYTKTRKIELCELYYSPYNFTRTGCKGCPYNVHLAQELDVMEKLLPSERRQCEFIWKPVYDEYRRIGYRKMRKEHKE